MRCVLKSSKFKHVSLRAQYLDEHEGCVACVRECARGVREKCVQFATFLVQYVWGHARHEHGERAE
eukprot:11308426-Alexandrium_andersonii.AAC.1